MTHEAKELNQRINTIYKICDKFYLNNLIKDTAKRL